MSRELYAYAIVGQKCIFIISRHFNDDDDDDGYFIERH